MEVRCIEIPLYHTYNLYLTLMPVLLSYHGNGLCPVSRGSSIFYLSMNLEGASACRVDSILMCLKFLDVLDLKTHGKLAVCF